MHKYNFLVPEPDRTSVQCTTEIWSTEVSNDSLFSFTIRWLTKLFEKKEEVLHAACCDLSSKTNSPKLTTNTRSLTWQPFFIT